MSFHLLSVWYNARFVWPLMLLSSWRCSRADLYSLSSGSTATIINEMKIGIRLAIRYRYFNSVGRINFLCLHLNDIRISLDNWESSCVLSRRRLWSMRFIDNKNAVTCNATQGNFRRFWEIVLILLTDWNRRVVNRNFRGTRRLQVEKWSFDLSQARVFTLISLLICHWSFSVIVKKLIDHIFPWSTIYKL